MPSKNGRASEFEKKSPKNALANMYFRYLLVLYIIVRIVLSICCGILGALTVVTAGEPSLDTGSYSIPL